MTTRLTLLFLAVFGVSTCIQAQNELDERALIEVKDGISISKDSLFLLNLRFRMQNRLGFTTVSGEDLSARTIDARVRRLRLRLDGFVLQRRLQYYIQLNFSRADLDLDGGGTVAQPVRDAMVYYHFNDRVYIGVGQSKLPGNRQRVISSGNQQFPDRSIANGTFTLDRDYGVFGYWTIPISTQEIQLKGALSTGDGRGASPGNSGMGYTGRLEWLPFGKFTNKGDYSEGDLEFEPRPKLSFGATYHFNDRAYRTGGQLGNELYASRTFTTAIADLVLKYQGWALSSEFFDRQCDDPITTNAEGAVRFVPTGQGLNLQLSKFFRSKFEVAGRYTSIKPASNTAFLSNVTEECLLGVTRYLNGHRIKLQTYAGYRWLRGDMALDASGNAWTAMFQVEFGI
ncbi:MAG: porin [Flavobacteriales bacterium]|nr:porin [Flavobacteriales bacterium]